MNFEKTIVQTIEATNIVENAIECFDAGGREGFKNYYFENIYKDIYGENYESELSFDEDVVVGLESESDEYKYEYKYMDVTITVSDSTITISVKAIETGKSLLRGESVTYTK